VQVQLGTDVKTLEDTQQEILSKIKKSNRRAGTNVILNILIFAAILAFAGLFAFKFFPQFTEMVNQYIN